MYNTFNYGIFPPGFHHSCLGVFRFSLIDIYDLPLFIICKWRLMESDDGVVVSTDSDELASAVKVKDVK
jgi:hypothetical protein